jgi:hypothetical protein
MGLALFALFAFGALTATSAMASTLLAEWLLNGAAITSENLVEIKGSLLLRDSKGILGSAAAVECRSFSFDGWVGPNSLDYVSEVLNAASEPIGSLTSGLALSCEATEGCETNTKPSVYFLGLPWESEVALLEQTGGPFFADFLTKKGGGTIGLEIINCLVLGSAHEDECTTERGAAELKLEGTTLLLILSEAFTLLAGVKHSLCTASGEESGVFSGEGAFVVSGGGELTASSEISVS